MSKKTKPRTFKLDKPIMRGADVKEWQLDVQQAFKKMAIECPITIDGVYGPSTRSYTAALVHASGLSIKVQMKDGVSPQLRIKLRNTDLTPAQTKSRNSAARKAYRAKLRQQWSPRKVAPPVAHILQDSWGFHPGVHDGVDVITNPDVQTFAMVKCRVIDVRASGWWGLGAPADPTIKAKGDGIVQMEVLENVGPFKKGMHIGYGHNEKAVVKVGDILEAGDQVAHAGLANAWHIHLMVNRGDQGTRGVGTVDPLPLINYAVKHG